ncbi:hypothetical protein HMPREF7215_0084 [Pyramidobacter piscolens W5455]|uniref:Uncharacterized protein n=1 Tax=Pyramidobacter piscolens W5455 TaxID=352165 RepID=A0ABM9ZUU8_9BACT|nr:hypothetical protein HMPREF7215_0084 [Pyramidobacter piscolens W5455]
MTKRQRPVFPGWLSFSFARARRSARMPKRQRQLRSFYRRLKNCETFPLAFNFS